MLKQYEHWQRTGRNDPLPRFALFAAAGTAIALLAFAAKPLLTSSSAERRREFDDDAPRRLSREGEGSPAFVGKSVLINRPRAELYDFWRDFKYLPRFMENIRAVEVNGDVSTWTFAAPAGQTVTAEVEVIEDRRNERIAWKSTPQSQIATKGAIDFRDASAGRGTYVDALVEYTPPACAVGRAVADLFRREPHVQARHDMKRFKMLMEAGEVSTSRRTRHDS
ncbi:SRPBCC family protein [Fulvimarina endophytica]|uniref:SRPBCC family protein n=1 Tax=Fulvimarina endophytica TaxID=2293836 RepID=A0A371X9N5_9HYPH|nr:SRPBCC family protein [Fulvimarina endophytica]RFC65945.1 SRPBCC family protein [Fulvimarina endophytica]